MKVRNFLCDDEFNPTKNYLFLFFVVSGSK